MTTKQKIILGAGFICFMYIILTSEIGEKVPFVHVKYDDRIVEVTVKSESELEDLFRKSKANCLFFDGEYFFDDPPTKSIRDNCRTFIIDGDRKIINGNTDNEGFIESLVMTILATSAILLMTVVDPPGDDYGDY